MTQSTLNTLGQFRQRWITAVVGGLLAFISVTGHAEQVHRFASHEVHYIIIPTTFLESEIAAQYDVARARNRALINVSILDANKQAVTGAVSGSSSNLLGQTQYFEFRQVREGDAIYYLAELLHSDQELHRVTLEVALDTGQKDQIKFNQKMYWED